MKKVFLMALMALAPLMMKAEDVSVTRLTAENLTDPLGLNTAAPRLGWRIVSDARNVMQTAYRVLAATSEDLLAEGKADVWDSGRVESDMSQWVPYGGRRLRSGERVWWKVKTYTTAGESDWSEPAFWSVGLLGETHWQGLWIGMERPAPWDVNNENHSRLSARYVRKEFSLDAPVRRATLYICGLGLYELYLNGSRIGDQVHSPLPTDYRRTLLYDTFDVTDELSAENAVGVVLGNGHYFVMRSDSNVYDRAEWVNFGYPKVLLNIVVEFEDGTSEVISTDKSWKLTPDGPIRANNYYDGEEWDARRDLGAWTLPGYDDSSWRSAEQAVSPTGILRGRIAPNMKVTRTLSPVSVTPLGDRFIVDMGQNSTGWLRIRVKGNEGDVIRVRYAETLQEDGELYTANLGSAWNTDSYVCSGREDGSWWAPSFVYHGFRYAEISGYPDALPSDFVGEVMTDEMETTGSFACSDETLNKVYHNCYWGIMSDYKGFPVDCPQRDEREPWLGDRDMGAWGESYVFGNERLYYKWSRDIREAQREDGCVPNVAPALWIFYNDNVTWPFAFPSVCDMLYTHYGNSRAIEECYPNIRLWLEHLCDEYMDEDHILTRDVYGDWCVPPESPEMIFSRDPARVTEGPLLSTAYIVKVLQLLQRFAGILGIEEDVARYGDLERTVRDAFNARWLHVSEDGEAWYANRTVTANILPLAFGIVPPEQEDAVVASLVRTVAETNGGHVSCGVIGMQWLLKELSRRGHSDLAWLLATNSTYPSWGYMAERGATTVWELWNGDTADPAMNSGNHVMLIGDLISWCYENLGGIRPDTAPGRTGFRHIILQPDFDCGAEWADVSYESLYGTIRSAWRKTAEDIEWEVTVPANTTAEVHLPDGSVESLGSGHYAFPAGE